MAPAIARRLAQSVVLMLLISLVVFTLLRLSPGGPGGLLYGLQATQDDIAQLRERWGLDDPIHVQYVRWLANAATGDLGQSYVDGRPVALVIGERVPATLLLTVSALILANLAGLAMGVVAAMRRGRWADRVATTLATVCYSSPAFWIGILAISLFSAHLGWLPPGGMRPAGAGAGPMDWAPYLVLPATILALREAGRIARVVRTSMLEVIDQDYVRTAVAKGLPARVIALRHILRNAMLPLVSLIGLSIPGLISGAVVVETLFSWPGLGRLVVESALQRDYPVIMGEVLVVAFMAIVGNLIADLAYLAVDPRIARPRQELAHD
jgi:peptide/nickel transport system permease protein